MGKALTFTVVGKDFMDEVRQKAGLPWRSGELCATSSWLGPALCLSDLLRLPQRIFSNAQAVKPYCAALTSGTNPFVIHRQT